MSDPSLPSLRADAHRNQERVLDAARIVIAEIGPRFGVNDVARQAGVAMSTLYRRFAGREDLIRAVFQRYVTEEVEPLVALAVADPDPWQALCKGLEATVLTVADNAALLEAARDTAIITSAAAAGFLRPLGPALRRAQDSGAARSDITPDDLPALVAMVVATLVALPPNVGVTTRRMEALRPRIEKLTRELISALPESGRVDIMDAYAGPLPVFVICELLGVPAEDRITFAGWSKVMVDDTTPEQSMAAGQELGGYLSQLIETKRRQPDEALISALIDEADDDKLTHEELVAMSMLLLIAGHETTVNLISNGLLALLTHPDQLQRLRSDPALMPAAIEEFLRWDSPIHSATPLWASEDLEFSGVTIPAGSEVKLCLAAANRDPERFPGAEELSIDGSASGHMAFSHGLHHCLGAQLARIEGQEAIRAIITARPEMRLAGDPSELTYRRSLFARGLTALPVQFGG